MFGCAEPPCVADFPPECRVHFRFVHLPTDDPVLLLRGVETALGLLSVIPRRVWKVLCPILHMKRPRLAQLLSSVSGEGLNW